jgi:UDP:flavonoid glycosyltransferase YjiC (YdhE family)
MRARPHLLLAVTGHGYGHLAQVAPVVNCLREQRPGMHLTVMSDLPPAVLAARLDGEFTRLADDTDAVMRMQSAWQVDVPATCRAWREFHRDWEAGVRREVERLQEIRPDLLLADIPYRLLLAARLAGIPAVALCSLNWAAIHAAYCDGEADSVAIRLQMRAGYAAADSFITPAPALPMPELDNVHAIGPIARTGALRRDEILARLNRSAGTRFVLVALGGIDSRLPLAGWPRMEKVVWLFDRALHGNRDDLVDFTRLPLPFIDLLASSDAVLTKPGYGTYAEAVCNGTPLLTLARPDWPETPYLNAWARTHGRVEEITIADFRRGSFVEALYALWSQPPPNAVPAPSGIAQAAHRLLARLPSWPG